MIDILRSIAKSILTAGAQFFDTSAFVETRYFYNYVFTGHMSLAKVGGVACSLGHSQSLESQSD